MADRSEKNSISEVISPLPLFRKLKNFPSRSNKVSSMIRGPQYEDYNTQTTFQRKYVLSFHSLRSRTTRNISEALLGM